MSDGKARNQKFFTPRPGVRDWIEEYAQTIPAAGKGAPSVIINAAIAAFQAMSPQEQGEWRSRVMFPQQLAVKKRGERNKRGSRPKHRKDD